MLESEKSKLSPAYWERFRQIKARAAERGIYCRKCNERRNLGKDVTADVARGVFRCKTCQTACDFRKSN